MLFEHKSQPLAPMNIFFGRVFKSIAVATAILTVCLAIGVLGYHYIGHINWIDSVHNASMILSGMGPVVSIDNVAGKLFSSAYALFSGVAFIANISLILAPVAHRLFHTLHVEDCVTDR